MFFMTKIGRNDPCPCGSGKKYKKCCEAKTSSRKPIAAQPIEQSDLASQANKMSGLFQHVNIPKPKQETSTEESEKNESNESDKNPPSENP